jgi:Family of unknown function (DUF6680)
MAPIQPLILSVISPQVWLTIAAIIIGPVAALLIQKYLEERRAERNRRIRIFQALMANRASRLSPGWVEALNGIETEFYGEKKVIEAWRQVVDHLNSGQATDPIQIGQWNEALVNLANEMLYEMGKSLGYEFDRVTIKRNAYYPSGWGEVELENHAVRKKFLELLDGKRKLPVAVFEENFPPLADVDRKAAPMK